MSLNVRSGHVMRAAALALALTSVACAANGRPGKSSSFLIVDSLTAAQGGGSTTFGNSLASDVLTKGGVLEDLARATFRLEMKDPTATASSPINYVTLRGYRVTFTRADGRNTAGVDVPHPFDGALTVTVGESSTTASLVLVRVQAKLESPLAAMAGGGGAVVISTFADIVFYGTDQAGRDVTVNARISVNFADWSDAE